MHLRGAESKKTEEKANELKAFIKRFSANASKSKQATSRQKQLEKLSLVDLPVSTRKYPFIKFTPGREAGKDILRVDGLTKSIEGVKILDNVSFTIDKGDKVAFLSPNDLTQTILFQILMGELEADSGTFTWGVTTSQAYLPSDNSKFFQSAEDDLINWLREYSEDKHESFLRGFLGKMLFSGEEAKKKTNVLSGGEKVRCMFSKMMLSNANVLLLDGPTSHLDLESITAVNDGLKRFKGTILLTSHDHEMLQTVTTRVIDINSTLVEDKHTTFDAYLGLE
jgi:ATPase subunit of ABC transporter with duplicated ATPase domains